MESRWTRGLDRGGCRLGSVLLGPIYSGWHCVLAKTIQPGLF